MQMDYKSVSLSFCIFHREKEGLNIREFGSGENESGPLECAPLSQWDPRVAEGMVMNMVVEEIEFEATKGGTFEMGVYNDE